MNKELIKRILSSIVLIPLALFFIIKGSILFVFFISICFFIIAYEWHTMSKKNYYYFYGLIFLIFSFLTIYILRIESNNYLATLFVLTICVSTDIGGYVFGKLFKGPKLTKISPNKTLSGVLGSFVFSLSTVFLLGFIVEIVSGIESNSFFKTRYFVLAIIFSIAAQLGDLTISYLKRLEKIKDTGKILPGHGGIFDRIDGLIFVIILAYIVYNLKLFP